MTETIKFGQENQRLAVSCFVGSALCGVDTEPVHEIVKVGHITPVHHAPDYVVGIMNLRGRVVTVIDLGMQLDLGATALTGYLKANDWGPYDYHRDFNLTYPLQLMGDVSYSLGSPRWFGYAQSRLGMRVTWRSLDEHSPRYGGNPLEDPDGCEWEIRTYLHLTL